MKFIGREKELKQLRELYDSSSFEFALLMGRRRVGKSELLFESTKGIKAKVLYFAAAKVNYSRNFNDLCEYVSSSLAGTPFLFSSIEALIDFVSKESKNQDIVFIIDEFSYFVKENDEFLGLFARAVDKQRDSEGLKIVIAGSMLDIMSELDKEDEPLHGRFSAKITLHPFSYREVKAMFPEYNNEEIVQTYAFFGGMPFYLSKIKKGASPVEEMERLILSPDSFLELEITSTLSSEINKVSDANAILLSIATGANKYKDIATRLGKKDASGISYVLDKLIKMDLVKKVAPIDAKKDSRKTSYFIKDNLFAFYFRYVFLHQKERETMGEEVFYKSVLKDKIESDYLPKVFENIAAEFLSFMNRNGKFIPPFSEIGTYYFDDPINKINRQFDVVVKREDGYIPFEVKYRNGKMSQGEVDKEIEQVNSSPLKAVNYGFISKNGFSSLRENDYFLFSLDDLFE